MKHARASRHHPRGMTLLIALAVISVVTAATLVSLRVVSQESEMQGRERHSREAFFAAEAGLAEGRELLTLMLRQSMTGGTTLASDAQTNGFGVTKLMQRLPPVTEAGFPKGGIGWYEAIPTTPYTLQAGVGLALDPTFTQTGLELRDPKGNVFASFPEQRDVTYRVVMHDDDDPFNKAVWVVSLGEVQGAQGVVLARSVVRALVFAESKSAGGAACADLQCTTGSVGAGPSAANAGTATKL